MIFTLEDFDSLISKDQNQFKKVNNKFKKLVEIISKRGDYFSGVHKYKTRCFGFLSKSKEKKVFFNLQINSEDLSVEFQINNKTLILKFIKNVEVETLKTLRKLGDCEIAVWDKNKKVCKLYPDYLDNLALEFLLNKIKTTKKPIFKVRKIYSRNKPILKSTRLVSDIEHSIKQMEILCGYT